jgi:hypothetical protein
LVEEHDAVGGRVEVPPQSRPAPRTRAAVHDDGRLTVRVAADFPVHELAVAGVEHAVLVRFDLWIARYGPAPYPWIDPGSCF